MLLYHQLINNLGIPTKYMKLVIFCFIKKHKNITVQNILTLYCIILFYSPVKEEHCNSVKEKKVEKNIKFVATSYTNEQSGSFFLIFIYY